MRPKSDTSGFGCETASINPPYTLPEADIRFPIGYVPVGLDKRLRTAGNFPRVVTGSLHEPAVAHDQRLAGKRI